VDYIEKFESFASVSRRMAETLKKLKQVSDKKYRVIIVTHDAVAGQLVKTFSNDELSGINPGDFLSLEKKDGKLVVTRVGDITEGNSETDVSV
jgi:broad specificity phosphatase PhoE